MTPLNKYLNLTFFSLFFIINWDVIWTYIFGQSSGENTGLILFFFVFIGIADNIKSIFFKRLFRKPYIIWLIWIVYALSNTFLKEESTSALNMNLSFVGFVMMPLIVILIIGNLKMIQIRYFLNMLIFSFFFRIFLSAIFDSYSSEFGGYRFGSEFNANLIAFGGIIMGFLIFLKKAIFHKISAFDKSLLIIAVLLIVLTASRKSFLAIIIMTFGYLMIFSSGNFLKKYLKILIYSFIIISSSFLVLKDSVVVERMTKTFNTTKSATNELEMFDGRALQYIDGMEVFKENYITGIGLLNFMNVDQWGLALHSEYLVQLVECGIIGFSIFLFFHIYIIRKLVRFKKIIRFEKAAKVFLLYYIIFFILSWGGWSYNIIIFWIIPGLAIRFINQLNLSPGNNNKFKRTKY